MKTLKAALCLTLSLGILSGCGQDIPTLPSLDNDVGITCANFLNNTNIDLLNYEDGQYGKAYGTVSAVTARILISYDGDSLAEQILRSNNSNIGSLFHQEARKYCTKNSNTDVARAYTQAINNVIETLSLKPETSFCFSVNNGDYDIDDVVRALPKSSTKDFWESDFSDTDDVETYCEKFPHHTTKSALDKIYRVKGQHYNESVNRKYAQAQQKALEEQQEAQRIREAEQEESRLRIVKRLNVNLFEEGLATCKNFRDQTNNGDELKQAAIQTIKSTPMPGDENKDAALKYLIEKDVNDLISRVSMHCTTEKLEDAVYALSDIAYAPKKIKTELNHYRGSQCITPDRCDSSIIRALSDNINACTSDFNDLARYESFEGCYETVIDTYDGIFIHRQIRDLKSELSNKILNMPRFDSRFDEAATRDVIDQYAQDCVARYTPPQTVEDSHHANKIISMCGPIATERKNKRALEEAFESEASILRSKLPRRIDR